MQACSPALLPISSAHRLYQEVLAVGKEHGSIPTFDFSFSNF